MFKVLFTLFTHHLKTATRKLEEQIQRLRRVEAVAALVSLEIVHPLGSFLNNAFTVTPWQDRTVSFCSTSPRALSEGLLREEIVILSVQSAMA